MKGVTMKKSAERLIALLLVLCLMIGTSNITFANTDRPEKALKEDANNFVISEYDLYKDLSQKSDSELKLEGYSDKNIKELREKNPKAELKKLSEKSILELKALGYDQERINAIYSVKNLDENQISDEVLRVVWAKVELTLRSLSYTTTGTLTKGTTNARLMATWKWDLCPSTTYIDKLVFSWGKSLASKDADITIKHYSSTDRVKKTTKGTVAEKDPNHGCALEIKFIAGLKNGGNAYITLYSSQQALKNIECKVTYGHSMVTLTPSVSWNGASVSFGTSTKDMGSKTITLE